MASAVGEPRTGGQAGFSPREVDPPECPEPAAFSFYDQKHLTRQQSLLFTPGRIAVCLLMRVRQQQRLGSAPNATFLNRKMARRAAAPGLARHCPAG